jgi:Outer membrane protein Omp28
MKVTKLLFFLIIFTFLSSCYQDTSDFFRTTNLTLTADRNAKIPGKIIYFTIKTDSGINATNEATIYVKDVTASLQEEILNAPNITSQEIKTYKVYAKYKDLISNEITIEFDPNAQSFVKRVLIEDYTGTWCVNCPTVSYGIEQLKLQTDKAVPVAIHRGPNAASSDPFNFDAAQPLEDLVGVASQYPTAKLNRIKDWRYPQYTQNNLDIAINLTTGEVVRLGLAMNAELSGNTVNLNVKAKFFKDYTNLKLVVYVLENDLIYPQKNSTNFYGGLSVIPNFEHDHVVRATFTDILGDAIPSAETFFENVYTRNFSVAIPANIANTANMEFVAFVVGQDNKAINVRSSKLGDNQDFEENLD